MAKNLETMLQKAASKDAPVFLLVGSDKYALIAMNAYLRAVCDDASIAPEYKDEIAGYVCEFDEYEDIKTPD